MEKTVYLNFASVSIDVWISGQFCANFLDSFQ